MTTPKVTFRKKQWLRAPGKGPMAPRANINGGTIYLSSAASEALTGLEYAMLGFSAQDAEGKVTVVIRGVPTPKEWPVKIDKELWEEDDLARIRWTKDKKSCYLSALAELREIGADEEKGASYAADADSKHHFVMFKVPIKAATQSASATPAPAVEEEISVPWKG